MLSVPDGKRLLKIAKDMGRPHERPSWCQAFYFMSLIRYVGPINWHHLYTLVETLEKLKHNSGHYSPHLHQKGERLVGR